MFKPIIALLVFCLVPAPRLLAAEGDDGEVTVKTVLSSLNPGQRVRVGTSENEVITGEVTMRTRFGLVLSTDSGEFSADASSIQGLWVRKRATVPGAIVGGLAGALAGAIMVRTLVKSTCEGGDCGETEAALLGAFLGGVGGAGVGAAVGTAIVYWEQKFP